MKSYTQDQMINITGTDICLLLYGQINQYNAPQYIKLDNDTTTPFICKSSNVIILVLQQS